MINLVKSFITHSPLSWSQFRGGRKPECPEETLEVRLRSTETQSTDYICSRGERRD